MRKGTLESKNTEKKQSTGGGAVPGKSREKNHRHLDRVQFSPTRRNSKTSDQAEFRDLKEKEGIKKEQLFVANAPVFANINVVKTVKREKPHKIKGRSRFA